MNSTDRDRESRLKSALEAFKRAWRVGETISAEQYCLQHPDLAPDLHRRIEEFLYVAEEFVFREDKSRKRTGDDTSDGIGEVIGDFRIVREIGRGGMGTVYEAEQLSLNRKVALKVLSPHLRLSVEAVIKFHREAEAGGRQRHPGIVAVYAVGEHEGSHFITQELVEGGFTLANKLAELSELDELPKGYFRDAARVVRAVAEALEHAHLSGVIHRDIKPSNILLTRNGQPKVSDFGLAKIEDALALSRTGDLVGTPYYMSPEQAMSHRIKIDKRTDIFSLGVTLYEVLTMKIPFEGDTSHEVLKKIIISDPVEPVKDNPRVPRDLSMICLKAMEKNPDRRYQSMQEFAEDLDRFLSGDVILAKPSGPGTRLWRRIKRNPIVSTAVVVAVLLLMAFAVVVPWIIAYKDKRALEEVKLEQSKTLAAKNEAVKERERANEEAEKSGEEAKTSRSVLDFLINLFESPDPYVTQGKEIAVTEILDQGVEQIKNEFNDQPIIKARLIYTMGIVHLNMGSYADAQALLEESQALRIKHLGVEHVDTLACMNKLTVVYGELGDYEKAESQAQKTLETCRRALGEEHPVTVSSMICLANLYRKQGQYKEAEPLYLEGIQFYQGMSGNHDVDLLGTMHCLANLYLDQGRLEEAERQSIEVLEGLRCRLGDDHPSTIASMDTLIIVYREQGRYDEAEPLMTEVLERSRRVLGNGHPHTLGAIENLASLYQRQGRYDEAHSHYLKSLEGRRHKLGTIHPHVLSSMHNLANHYIDQGRFTKAEPLLLNVIEARRQAFGEENPILLPSISSLASLYAHQGRFEEAEVLFEEVVRVRQRVIGDSHPKTLLSKAHLAALYGKQKRYAEAEPLLIEALEGLRRSVGEDHPATLYIMDNLGTMYREQGRLEEAVPLCRETLEACRREQGDDHPATLKAMRNYAALLKNCEKYVEAESLVNEAIDGMERVLGVEHTDTLNSWFILALVYKNQERNEEAERLLERTIQGFTSALGPGHPNTLQVRYSLALLYVAGERYEEAYPIAKELVDLTPKEDALYASRKELLNGITGKLDR